MSKLGAQYRKISELEAASSGVGTTLVASETAGGVPQKLTLAQIATYIETGGGLEDLSLQGPSPSVEFVDTNTDDEDVNASITVNATATGTGAEDIDVTFSHQVGGAAKNYLLTDASDSAVTLGYSGCKLGFYGVAEVAQASALTAAETTLTNAGTAADYAIQAMTNTSPYGFVTQAEGETVVEVVLNNQARINEIATALENLGLIGT